MSHGDQFRSSMHRIVSLSSFFLRHALSLSLFLFFFLFFLFQSSTTKATGPEAHPDHVPAQQAGRLAECNASLSSSFSARAHACTRRSSRNGSMHARVIPAAQGIKSPSVHEPILLLIRLNPPPETDALNNAFVARPAITPNVTPSRVRPDLLIKKAPMSHFPNLFPSLRNLPAPEPKPRRISPAVAGGKLSDTF